VNERADFLVTTTPPVNEDFIPVENAVFPQVVDGGGFTTQFILYGTDGSLDLRDQNGVGMNLTWQ
jgi:hypothetical protein